ncbi:hypothetical protein I553_7624 [Mycobacterium xenopi 4042]|uniref:Uncharacterized protein n=1 Tax=Mycobacterium xenopi 4042 TaxID=1299334 RepID=X8ANN8_MYCXE|nr:hypothetical protein I553_7624 [Mycobacterium xenopi 4042]
MVSRLPLASAVVGLRPVVWDTGYRVNVARPVSEARMKT